MAPFGAPGPTLAEVGETGLLARLLGDRPTEDAGAGAGRGHAGVVLGPGDDAALWRPPRGQVVALTQDALVEGVDFHRDWTTPYLLGRRTLALSLSDLAAMGAAPAFCLVTLCAPGDTPVADVEALHEGLQAMAAEHTCPVVGGDVSAIDGPIVLDVVAGGTVAPDGALRRDAGRPGDALVVTGVLGRAAAGLRLLRDPSALASLPREVAEAATRVWRSAQLDPAPRVAEGRQLAFDGVRCAGDLSDGLLVDAGRTAAASGCAAELWCDALPVDPPLREAFGDDWLALAAGGGEDFELLAAVPPTMLDTLVLGWPVGLARLSVVGRLVEGSGLRLLDRRGGAEVAPPPVASRHFGS